jgi:pimeloyl-ACP methyl ester carboxylesterase
VTDTDIPRANETPAECVARIDATGLRREVDCGDGVMVWRVFGDGPPLVLFHGGHGSWTHWIRNIPALARHYTLYVMDLPGFGESDAPPGPVDGAEMARIVCDSIDAVIPAPARYDIAGFSFGGIVGGLVAARHGERVGQIVIIGSSGLGLPSGGFTGLRKWTPDMPDDALMEVHRNNLGVIMIADPAHIDDLALHLQKENTLSARAKSSAIARSDALRRALPDIRARVICLAGEHDVYVVRNLEERKKLFKEVQPEAPFRMVPGAGHWALYEAPDEFNAMLLELLGDQNPAAGAA